MVNFLNLSHFYHEIFIDEPWKLEDDSQYSEGEGWIHWFCSLEDHHFFCEIEEEYVRDTFNLYGLKERFNHYKYSKLNSWGFYWFFIANVWIWFYPPRFPKMKISRMKSYFNSLSPLNSLQIFRDISRSSWPLRSHSFSIHFNTKRLKSNYNNHNIYNKCKKSSKFNYLYKGLAMMKEKFLMGKFGVCPRVLCERQNVLPIGLSEILRTSRVKVFNIFLLKLNCL